MRGLTISAPQLRGNTPSGRCEKLDRLPSKIAPRVNPGGSVAKSADAAMRGLTRHFRVAFARKCSVCPRIAPKDQSGRHRSEATTVDCQEFGPTRSPLQFFTPS